MCIYQSIYIYVNIYMYLSIYLSIYIDYEERVEFGTFAETGYKDTAESSR